MIDQAEAAYRIDISSGRYPQGLAPLGLPQAPVFARTRLSDYAPRVGRDYFFVLLTGYGLLIRRSKRRVVTMHTYLPLFQRRGQTCLNT